MRTRRRVQFDTVGESMARGSFKEECDINNVMRQFVKTGLIEHTNEYSARYGDFVDAPQYHQAMNDVVLANNMFQSLPAKLRKRFDNDPAEFLAFCQDPANEDEMRDLGMLKHADPPEAPPQSGGKAPGGAGGQPSGEAASKGEKRTAGPSEGDTDPS